MLLGRDRSDMYKYCTRISHGDAAAKTKRRICWSWISIQQARRRGDEAAPACDCLWAGRNRSSGAVVQSCWGWPVLVQPSMMASETRQRRAASWRSVAAAPRCSRRSSGRTRRPPSGGPPRSTWSPQPAMRIAQWEGGGELRPQCSGLTGWPGH